MKIFNILLLLSILPMLAICSQRVVRANYRVVPLPQQIEYNDGKSFMLTASTEIHYWEADLQFKRNAEFLSEYIEESTGVKVAVKPYKNSKKAPDTGIVLGLNPTVDNHEGYSITISQRAISVEGQSANGVFYAIQTLRKSLPAVAMSADVEFAAGVIRDAPRFEYRGLMLDVARHFQTVDFVKEFIDLLALHNMNTFHWHLTDDQGWRIEIDKYPRLTEIGSRRPRTVIGHHSTKYVEKPHGGFYTKQQIREMVEYARERCITIIPEVDFPGHMLAALTAYPELGCTAGPYEVACTWGIFDDVLCLGNETTMKFLEDVLAEVVELFPSKYIHIGGDEAPRKRWKECPKCQLRIQTQGLKADNKFTAEDNLQSYCTSRIEQFLLSKGRNIIGWDEIMEGNIAPGATVMSWRGVKGGIQAAKLGHKVIMTPDSHLYFDFYQWSDTSREPAANGGCLTVEHVYGFEPQQGLNDDQKGYVLGTQANLWAEFITSPEQAEYMVLPRMAALAEVQWTQPKLKNYENFVERLKLLKDFYQRDGRNYARHLFE